jgi:hypothetical protein
LIEALYVGQEPVYHLSGFQDLAVDWSRKAVPELLEYITFIHPGVSTSAQQHFSGNDNRIHVLGPGPV